MNAERRKKIEELFDRIEAIKGEIEELSSAEREAFDNMPESLQQSDGGQKNEAAADALEEAVDNLDGAIANLETAKE